jgi:hypothetical protein
MKVFISDGRNGNYWSSASLFVLLGQHQENIVFTLLKTAENCALRDAYRWSPA